MSQAPQPEADSRRSPSMARHRRESFWQIVLPMLVALLVLGLAFVLITLSGPAGISGVADLALIVVSVPLLLLGLIPVAVILALLAGMGWLLRNAPPYTRVAQEVSARMADIVERAMQQVSNVVIPAAMGFSMARRFFGGEGTDSGDGSQPE